ncbi:peptidylprolyl isomerase [Paenibacillus psychroresistens]|uniref:Peptidylprolyl isomerase n=1 Tax=Paenibacillus psychroresistens TaxID=1778678 RepID=A0A6B8RMA4_9BACL|nr:peptidylprolyl isomerase [Paenibacillus psychroresistens]QGQ96792.1 peptidylprolyl isomerase [Paenibacillus psychroresistens]
MKDKVKGLIIGLSIGSLIAGSAAYASATQIEVVFKSIKYMFNGVEKKSTQGQGFVYNNTTYVPLRFVGEALGQEVKWDEKNQTVWFSDKPAAKPTDVKPATGAKAAAVYKGGSLSTQDFNTFLAIMQLYNPDYTKSLTDAAFNEQMLKDDITLKILAKRGQALTGKSFKEDAAAQLADLKIQFAQVFGTEVTWDKRLLELKITDANMVTYLEERLLGNVYLTSKVSDSSLRDDYIKGLSTNAYDNATVSHILISLTLEDGTARTPEDALKRANEVIAKLNAGEAFADLAKQYSDDAGSKDNGGQYESTNVNGWVTEFKDAVIALPLNKVSEPVLSQFGYHIIRVDAKSQTTFEQAKEALSANHIQQAYQTFTTNELPGLIVSTPSK